MITHIHRSLRVVLYEGQGSIALSPEARTQVMSALLDKGYAVTRATTQGGSAMPHDDRSLLVLGLFPDSVASLAQRGAATAPNAQAAALPTPPPGSAPAGR